MKTETKPLADKRALAMGAENKRCNNCDPDWRGHILVNGENLEVISSSIFNGILHYGILGRVDNENVVGWVPAVLCEVL